MKGFQAIIATITFLFISIVGFSQVDTNLFFKNLVLNDAISMADLSSSTDIDNTQKLKDCYSYDSGFDSTISKFEIEVQNDNSTLDIRVSQFLTANTGNIKISVGSVVMVFLNSTLNHAYFANTYLVNSGDLITVQLFQPSSQTYANLDITLTSDSDPNSLFDQPLNETVALNMFPNPTTENLNFEFNVSANQVSYTIYSINGKMMRSGALNNTLYVGDLTKGVYLIHINVDGKEIFREFIVR